MIQLTTKQLEAVKKSFPKVEDNVLVEKNLMVLGTEATEKLVELRISDNIGFSIIVRNYDDETIIQFYDMSK